MAKGKKPPHSEETNQAFEPDSDIAETLESSDWEFKITKINILRALMKKIG